MKYFSLLFIASVAFLHLGSEGLASAMSIANPETPFSLEETELDDTLSDRFLKRLPRPHLNMAGSGSIQTGFGTGTPPPLPPPPPLPTQASQKTKKQDEEAAALNKLAGMLLTRRIAQPEEED